MPFLHAGFGLILAADRPIRSLVADPATPAYDVQIWLDQRQALPSAAEMAPESIRHVSPYRDAQGAPTVTVWEGGGGAFFRLRFVDGAEFVLDGSGSRVWATGPDTVAPTDVDSYLLGPVMGFLLRLRGITCLHGSAVAVAGRAIAFLGPSCAGKSTTAAAFAQQGYPVLADDIIPLTQRGRTFLAQPGYPRLRLCPDTLAPLSATARSRPPLVAPAEGRRLYLDLLSDGYRFQQQPLPLAAVYVLENRLPDPAAPYVRGLSGRDRLLSLVANTYASVLLDRTLRAREFEVLSRLVAQVPVRQVCPHVDPDYLPALCEVIRSDFATVSSADALPCTTPRDGTSG